MWSLKPGRRSGNPSEFDRYVYPQGGDLIRHHAFHLSISNSRREVFRPFVSTDNYDNYFLPGGGDFDNFF